MSASLLKTIATQNKSFAEKAAAPHARDIDRIMTVEVEAFEDVGEQISVVGTDLLTGEKIRMFREWSRSPRVKDPNPLEKAYERVEAGGVITFTDVREIRGLKGEKTYSSEGFVTVTRNDEHEGAEVHHDVPAFVDAPETMPNGKKIQMYNIVRPDEAALFTTAEEFFQAFKDFFQSRAGADDSVVIRGFSGEENATSSIRVLMAPGESFRDRMTRFVDETHFIEMVGELEGTFEVTGRELLNSLSNPESTTTWEVIPVTGVRKRLTVKDDPELSERLEQKGHSLHQNFVHMGENPTTGCRQVSIGLRHTSYGNGASYTDVVSAFHAPGQARPLAMLETPNVKNIDDVIPGYREEVAPVAIDDTPEMDFSAYIEDLAGELNAAEFDFLDQPILEDPAENAPAANDAAEIDIDLSLFEPDPEPEAPPADEEPVEAPTKAAENAVTKYQNALYRYIEKLREKKVAVNAKNRKIQQLLDLVSFIQPTVQQDGAVLTIRVPARNGTDQALASLEVTVSAKTAAESWAEPEPIGATTVQFEDNFLSKENRVLEFSVETEDYTGGQISLDVTELTTEGGFSINEQTMAEPIQVIDELISDAEWKRRMIEDELQSATERYP